MLTKILLATYLLILSSGSIFADDCTDFSGEWRLIWSRSSSNCADEVRWRQTGCDRFETRNDDYDYEEQRIGELTQGGFSSLPNWDWEARSVRTWSWHRSKSVLRKVTVYTTKHHTDGRMRSGQSTSYIEMDGALLKLSSVGWDSLYSNSRVEPVTQERNSECWYRSN